METGTQAPMEIQAIGGSDGPTSILVQDADETETDAVETEIAETETVETETVDETEFLGAEIETEDDFPDSYAEYSVVGADWDSSYDSESGDYSVTFSMSQDGYDLFQILTGNTLAVCNILYLYRFPIPMDRQVHHGAQGIAPFCRN